MADEKHISRGSNSRSKKDKLKKVPQRGLGVAQLEKMRLESEEHQKKDSVEISNFRPPFPPSSNPIPLPSPSQTNLPSPNALFRHTPLVSNSEIAYQSSTSKAILSPRCGDWSTISNVEFNLEGENRMLDNYGLAFQPRVNVPYDTNVSVLPLPSVPQRSHQLYQLPSSSSSTVNPSPSSALSYRMELPSNQIFRSNNYIPLYPEEDKMVGMKRAYPFCLETPPAPSFNRNFHSTYSSSTSKSDELNSCSNRYTVHLEPRNKYIREGPSNSSPLPERNHSEVITDKGKLNGDFLSLAPPEAAAALVNSNSKHPLSYVSQENAKGQIQGNGASGLLEQPSFNFFPVELRNNQTTTKDETIDLNLKL